jgi:hypothetical protein
LNSPLAHTKIMGIIAMEIKMLTVIAQKMGDDILIPI